MWERREKVRAKTVRYLPDGRIEVTQVDVGDPKEGEITVEGAVCGICSWDIVTCKLGSKFAHPAPPGHEGLGYVRKVGPGVKGFREGDKVACGGFQTLKNVGAESVHKIPDSDIPDEFWLVEPVSCVITGLDHCHIRPGDRIAVVGCGFMGLLFLQALVRSYADQVIAIDIEKTRLDLARTLGVQEAYDASEADPDSLARELKSRDIDIVVDTTGSQQGLDLAAKIVKSGGLINLFGWIKGDSASFNPSRWHIGGFSIVNSSPTSRLRDPFPAAIRLIHKKVFDLRPLVTHVVSLEDYPVLMGKILAGDKTYLKGVVKLR
jgi:threonine dehydrogenase-like Zn-dependent dehydrogenase